MQAAKRRGWLREKEQMIAKAIGNARRGALEGETNRYKEYAELFRSALEILTRRLAKSVEDEEPLSIKETKELIESAATALKAERLVFGDSTENVGVAPNRHKQAVELLAALNIQEAEVVRDPGTGPA